MSTRARILLTGFCVSGTRKAITSATVVREHYEVATPGQTPTPKSPD
jgi:hypothetical protein